MKRISCLLLGGLLLSGCGKEEAPPEPIRPVVFVEAQPESMQDFGRFAGNIQARYQSVLGFRVAGRIARRNVDVGSEVKKGDLLATLDPTDQQNNVRGRQGDLANVQAQWINAQANARRQQELFDRGVGAQAQLDIAQTDLKTARSSLEQAKAAEQQARDQLSYSELHSDHDAVVTEWKVEAGQVVTAGQEVVTLARPDIKEAVIDLPAALADQLPRDVVFTVASQLNPDINTTATIREIEPQADRTTRTRRARLSLAETPAAFRLGTAISVTLSSTITARMRLPINALQEVDGKRQIWIVDPQSQTVNPRAVNITSRDNDSFVLADGVKAGEQVVSAGVNSLKPGQKVKIDEESPR
ncbi:RND family efflux transporter MFP subunit [Pseudomonas syringae pv. delphinii]|uniref:RND family efflux transporter MFP subunit n=1 Tax=Pseudomonas syringae pv. delphinii TaxID=192088 RepID=A0A0P9P764_9PSED|nr:efflux RND transporter periplasmic adaptor subunit [Pseudomonas syringae group genomosp. 3]KPX13425.1 RND family efflux transporter MFP subunit [Pseudomonas syringae pv. delphinii]RMP17284.1 RND family efflux transporter MFP subunit [Pseudomonas syringae pv. delphinii]RMP27481.1 RND family efflux transporter MFP subunit [Pseudomonas syringae pv. delphinii]RMQ21640.1 RND family efflux transporter MFP subunit [Pseudomonas syringae pv. delphinii]